MQRIATLVLCAGLWGPNASAQNCETIGTIISGFVGGATGFGMVRYIGPATSWISAGLYGAGMTVGALGGRSLARASCESIEAIMRVTAEIYCFSGEYLCESVEDVARSLARDFQLCSECTPDEVIEAFPMEDNAREIFLLDMQIRRGAELPIVRVIPRGHIISVDRSVIDSYYTGMQATFRLQRALQRKQRLIR